MNKTLRGMTWSHPRGYDPLVAASKAYKDRTGVEITWDMRSLQDFESYPVEDLARNYDLIIIDHPHVGQVVAEDCLEPLDVPERVSDLETLASASVGPSFESYTWQGRQWALPVDAATQVQAWRPDLINAPAPDFDTVMDLARHGRILLPLRSPHALMTFYTLAANVGTPCAVTGDTLIPLESGEAVYARLQMLADAVDSDNFDLDPIDALERLADEAGSAAVIPYVYGYVSYSMKGFRPHTVQFANIPAAGSLGCAGGAIGGTGLAISRFSSSIAEARDFAFWVAGAGVQAELYTKNGGQAGHRAAWEDEKVNREVNGFYRETLETLERSYLRPRYNGYMQFQEEASDRITRGLKAGERGREVLEDINALFGASQRAADVDRESR